MTRQNLLTEPHRWDVTRVAAPGALLAFDFDGTLAPIVASPPDAAMRETTRVRLTELARRRQVAIITGRALADIEPRLRGVPTSAIVGNHGSEPSPYMAAARESVAAWLPVLHAAVGHLSGLVIENKGASLAVHYRHASSPEAARAAIAAAVRRLGDGVRHMEGIEVVNLVPVGAPTKGDALARLRAECGASAVFYIGDEETDEDAFAVLDDDTSLAVRVGASDTSRARYFVPSQSDVDALLDLLLAATEAYDTVPPDPVGRSAPDRPAAP